MMFQRSTYLSLSFTLLFVLMTRGAISAEASSPTAADQPAAQTTQDGFPVPQQRVKANANDPSIPVLGGTMTPLEKVAATPVGELKNPYKDANDQVLELGRKKYLSASCNGCHGGTGGGGMCPPLSNEVWVYGSDDDTLYRLIALGSDEFTKQTGVSRKGRENVVGPMPGHGQIVKTDDDMWKIITFIRSIYRGDPSRKNW